MARPQMSKPDAASRRFVIVQMALGLAFVAVMFASRAALERADSPASRWLLAMAPVAVLSWWAWEFVKVVRASDEMVRLMLLNAIAVGAGLVIFAATAWGMLESLVGAPGFPLFLIGPAFSVVYGVAFARLKASR